jgi:hypothetical protein
MSAPLTHNLSYTEAEEITKYENLALQIKNIRKLNDVSVHPLVISAEEVVIENFLKYLGNIGWTKNVSRVRQNVISLQSPIQ